MVAKWGKVFVRIYRVLKRRISFFMQFEHLSRVTGRFGIRGSKNIGPEPTEVQLLIA